MTLDACAPGEVNAVLGVAQVDALQPALVLTGHMVYTYVSG